MQRNTKSRELTMETVVGTLVFAALLSLSFFTILLSGEALFKKTYVIEIIFENVMGLREGDNIVTRGMPIGKVKKLSMEEDGVHVLGALRHPVNLREDYRVEVIMSSVLGGRYLQVHEGSAGAPGLHPDMVVTGHCPTDLVAEAAMLVADFREIADKINQGEGTLGRLVNDESLYEDAREVVGEIRTAVKDRRLLENLEETASNLNEIAAKINRGDGTLGKLVNEDDLYAEGIRVFRDARATLNDLRETAPIVTFTSIFFGVF